MIKLYHILALYNSKNEWITMHPAWLALLTILTFCDKIHII